MAFCSMELYNNPVSCPLADLYETETELVFKIELPGIEPECVSLQVIENFLIIENKPQKNLSAPVHEGSRFLCMERQTRAFRRIMNIPIAVDSTKGTARYRNGVITVRFPKLKGKWITIPIEQQ
ncbi:MAG TPA: Hsp20/alpha crystallin family protein [Dissulfurispiraceae bacterium]|nr:Hsp20/alpha crystallin family protein [Dissulfurispiraceae bacterium]